MTCEGDFYTPPNFTGGWRTREGTERPFFIWANTSEGNFKGRGIDIEGRFTVEGKVQDGDITFKKEYVPRDPTDKKGTTFVYTGKIGEEGIFDGEYYSGDKIPIATPSDGTFFLESDRKSKTLSLISFLLDKDLTRR